MDTFTIAWNHIMSIATFGGLISIVVLIYTLILPNDKMSRAVGGFVTKNILLVGFLISFAALVSSLIYSNVIGYPPCLLCWYARIAFYPQVILYAIAYVKREYSILNYSLALTLFGILVTGYHYLIENLGYSIIPCSTDGASCLSRYVHEYGFITIPFMGLVGFVALFCTILIAKRGLKTKAI